MSGLDGGLLLFGAGAVWFTQLAAGAFVAGLLGIGWLESRLGGVKAESAVVLGGGLIAATAAAGLGAMAHRAGPGAGFGVRWRDVPVGLGLFVLSWPVVQSVSMVSAWVYRAVFGGGEEAVTHETLRSIADHPGSVWTWGLIAAVVVLAPVTEEVMYRGFLQGAARRAVGSAGWGAVVTSAVFAAAHLPVLVAGSEYQVVTLWALGLAMGLAYERTGSIGVPIVMHGSFNAANVALVLAGA